MTTLTRGTRPSRTAHAVNGRRAGRPRRAGQRGRLARPGRLTYLSLLAVAAFSIFPLYWSAVVASQTNDAIGRVPPTLLPGGRFLDNASRVFEESEFAKALVNSFIVSGTVAVSMVLFSTLAGYAFAKLRFRGRNALMLVVVGTLMVPTQLGTVPLYILMGELGWINSLQAVIVPFMVSAFGVFFMRQYLVEAVPTELLEAGRMDGCSMIRLFWHVVMPAARPAAAVLGMLTFMQTWNEFFWPLLVMTPDNPTVQVALRDLAAGYVTDYSLIFTGTVIGTVPLIVVFVLLGRQIIGGIMQGAIKG